MLLKIFKNRTVSSSGTWGTKNENNYEILDFEFPEELEEYNKRIVYYLGNQKVWDAIIDNKAILTNAITTKGSVKAYVWCTKTDAQYETDVDFRTQLFEMHFYENENADGIVPTEEQVDGFNTMLTAMNEKIEEIDELETTIKNAEAQRQENEETRQNNEKTRQENEQTRQNQEAERERRTDEAIADIEDKTAEYNANAEAKTTAFNNNATQKTNDFNSNYTQKVNDFNSNATSKTNDFNSNASSKTTAFNDNATSKTNTFNSNASSKTTDFNTNAESKTSAFNDNATQKTTNFDNNASEKTDEFNTNAQNKIDEYDEHIVEYQAQIDELQEEVDELSENMPWNTTEQATEISVDDAATYSRNKLELFGNTSQDSTTGKNMLENNLALATINGVTFQNKNDGSISLSGTSTGVANRKIGSIPIQSGKTYILSGSPVNSDESVRIDARPRGVNNQVYNGWTSVTGPYTATEDVIVDIHVRVAYGYNCDNIIIWPQAEESSTATDYEPYTGGVPSPNPDYPQDIHVVTGENIISVGSTNYLIDFRGKNKFDIAKITPNTYIGKNGITGTSTATNLSDYIYVQGNKEYTLSYKCDNFENPSNRSLVFYTSNKQYVSGVYYNPTSKLFTFTPEQDGYIRFGYDINCYDIQIEEGDTATTYTAYNSIELCKIGSAQDYIDKQIDGNWYLYKAIDKITLDGTENWGRVPSTTDPRFKLQKNGGSSTGYSNYFKYIYIQWKMTNYSIGIGSNTISIRYDELADVTALKTWLSTHNTILYFKLTTPTTTQITDETLIAQLDAIYEHLQLVKGTNNITVTAEDLAPYMELSYMQDLPSKLDNLDSRLSLLE